LDRRQSRRHRVLSARRDWGANTGLRVEHDAPANSLQSSRHEPDHYQHPPASYSTTATLTASNDSSIPPANGAIIVNAPAATPSPAPTPTPAPTATPSPTPQPTSAVQPTATPTPVVTHYPVIPTPSTGAGGFGEQGLGLVLMVVGSTTLALPFLRRRNPAPGRR